MNTTVKGSGSIFDDLDTVAANKVPLSPIRSLIRSARVFPDKTAIIDDSRQFTYLQMKSRCMQLADALRNFGIKPGDVVSIMAPNVSPMIEAQFGIPMAGAVLNAINTRLDSNSVLGILRHCESKLVFIDEEYASIADAIRNDSELKTKLLTISVDDSGGEYEDFLTSGDSNVPYFKIDDEDFPISLNYTSGTTGNPKGVVYTHRGAALNAVSNALSLGMNPASVYLWTLPMFHCNGWTHGWSMVAVGGTQVCLRKVDPPAIFQKIENHKVSHLAGAPVVLSSLIHTPKENQRQINHSVKIATGGAAPPSAVIKAMEDLGFAVIHLYGLTETYGPSVICEAQDDWNELDLPDRARKMARQGVPQPLVDDVTVRDSESMNEVPWDGETMGELMIRSNTVMKGYLKNTAATGEVFAGDWYHTGDLGVMHPDGYVEVKDRSKDIIISGGENISSLEVEDVLYAHPDVMEAAVVARPDEKWGETPMAFVALKPGSQQPKPEDLIAFCREKLAGFKIPRHYQFGDLPKTLTGKIQKNVLRERVVELLEQEQ